MEEIDLMEEKRWTSPLDMKKDFVSWFEENKIEQCSEIKGTQIWEKARMRPLTVNDFALDFWWTPEDFWFEYSDKQGYEKVLKFIIARLTAWFNQSAAKGDVASTWQATMAQYSFGISYKKDDVTATAQDLLADATDAELEMAKLVLEMM